MTDTTPREADGTDPTTAPTAGDYAVPPEADPVVCDRCGAPFAADELLALHRGIDHSNALDEAEREAFEDAYATETEELRLFRLKALGALVLLYFGLLMMYAVFA